MTEEELKNLMLTLNVATNRLERAKRHTRDLAKAMAAGASNPEAEKLAATELNGTLTHAINLIDEYSGALERGLGWGL